MAKPTNLLWTLAESDEVQIATRPDPKSPVHGTTIWIVPTPHGVYVRSYKGTKGRWYQEALANPLVTIRAGRRKVAARAVPEHGALVIRAVDAGYRTKYGERWPDETAEMLRRSVLPTTLQLKPVSAGGSGGR